MIPEADINQHFLHIFIECTYPYFGEIWLLCFILSTQLYTMRFELNTFILKIPSKSMSLKLHKLEKRIYFRP